MKVLQISQYYTPRIGGVEKHLVKLNQELIKNKHQITVLTGNQERDLENEELINQVSIHRIDNRPSNNYKVKIWKQVLAHSRLLIDADIVQVHDVFWWIIPIYPLIFKKLFITFHGHEKSEAPDKKAIFWHRLANKLCKGSIAVGGFHQKYYKVIADEIIFGASEKENFSKDNRFKNKIIFVGRLITETGILTYLKALKILQDKKIIYQLDVFGDGPLMNKAKKCVKEMELSVVFHGTVPNAEKLFSNYPIAFVSSYLSITEALKQGCQIIAHYHNQFIKDYLELSIFKNYIFTAQTPLEIGQAILKAPSTKKVNKELSQTLSWPKIAETYQKLWLKK
jgi:glycosyltransferase involved in cell wall biosynthesis